MGMGGVDAWQKKFGLMFDGGKQGGREFNWHASSGKWGKRSDPVFCVRWGKRGWRCTAKGTQDMVIQAWDEERVRQSMK